MQDVQHDGSSFQQNIGGCLEAAIGEHGLAPSAYAAWLQRIEPHVATLKDDYRDNRLALLRMVEDTADIDAAEAALARLSEGAEKLVFFGTGGSSLGGQTLAQLAGWKIPGVATEGQKSRPRTRFYDNLDGETLAGVLSTIDLAKTRFIVTSK
ncbi:MAG: glucose-6-phosphate isomerase, partial [Hyphomicrobium denitrificans]|nr:glucose-6-phosphate isomerase [Hyphomicrobium denitrificans]